MFLTICLDDSKVEITRRFYERIGHQFTPERHGNGLPHFSSEIESVTLEIYPSIKAISVEDHLFIGFNVDDPETMKSQLIQRFGGSEGVATTKTGIATLRDPNGILVRLFPTCVD